MTSASTNPLFRNVALSDPCGFWADQMLRAEKVAAFLELDKNDVSKLANVSKASVRYDDRMPNVVREHLEQIANICTLVAKAFDNDISKTVLWFKTPNPLLGNISPRDMIRAGRYEKLRQFVLDAVEYA